MLAALLRGHDVPHPEVWLAVVAGLLSMSLALMVARFVFGRRREPAAEPPPPKESGPVPDPFEHGSATERRFALRRSGRQVRVFVTNLEATTKPVEGWVMDRSVGGMCLSLYEPIEKGAKLKVIAENAPEGTPWVEVEVKTVRLDGDRCEVGCQFLRTPSWSTLLLFG